MNNFTIHLSAVDTKRFSVTIARAQLYTPEDTVTALDFCRQNKVKMLIARCPVEKLVAAQALEKCGAFLMDSLVYYSLTKGKVLTDDNFAGIVRTMLPGEEKIVIAIAKESFEDYYGHYHADCRLDNKLCNEAYSSWAAISCQAQKTDDVVLVAELDGHIIGFLTVTYANGEGETVLSGVLRSSQKKGAYKALMAGGIKWCINKGATQVITSTQLSNFAVQKVWVRLGFEPSHAYYTFHKWFD